LRQHVAGAASGLAAALVGDASLAVQEAKQLWREDGLFMFVKWPALMVGATLPFVLLSVGTQPLIDQALGVSEEDIEERTLSFHVSRMLNSALVLIPPPPLNALLACHIANTLPSWKVALVDRVVKGKDHFYSSLLASVATGIVLHVTDVVRATVLHWHKATFFPDFISPRGSDEHDDGDDIRSEVGDEAEDEEEEEPSTARRVAYVASTALALVTACGFGAVLMAPVETITMRMAAQPHVYGPLGTLGTTAAIFRQEGAGGFFHGLVPAIIAQCGVSFVNMEEEADTGKVSL